jgi:hypothetical protein
MDPTSETNEPTSEIDEPTPKTKNIPPRGLNATATVVYAALGVDHRKRPNKKTCHISECLLLIANNTFSSDLGDLQKPWDG